MKVFSVLIFLFLFPFITPGQTVNLEWGKSTGGSTGDYSIAVVTDATGNVFHTGTFQGTVDMDPGPGTHNLSSQGTSDIYIAKYDALGNFLWAKQIGSNSVFNENVRAMAIDGMGNVYITGSFHNTVDFDPGPGIFNVTCIGTGYAAFLLKLDNNGYFGWAKNIAQSEYGNSGYSITTSASGNVYVMGTFKGLTDLDPGVGVYNVNSTNSAQEVFISKFDNAGNFLWSRQYSATLGIVGYSIEVDAQENIYTTGTFYGTGDFDPGAAIYNLDADSQFMGSWSDVFIAKLDRNGNFIWAKQLTGKRDGTGFDLALDQMGNLYITGEFFDETDFDPGPGTYTLGGDGYGETFIMKLTTGGEFVWAKQFDGPGTSTSHGRSVACDTNGDVYITGSFSEAMDFDPGPSQYILYSASGNSLDIYIAKLKGDGSFVFAKRIGNGDPCLGYSIKVDASNNIYVAGFFMSSPDFDPGDEEYVLTSNGSTDAFILKFSQCVQNTTETITATACNSYTLNNQVYTVSGAYIQQLQNAAGCDSTITLNLTIGGSKNTETVTACDSYVWQGKIYTNSGSYVVTYTGTNGCDSVRNLDLVIRNRILTTIDVTICEGENYNGYSVAGTYTDSYVAANGCDSIRTLRLAVNTRSRSVFNITICEGSGYWGHYASGSYIDTLVATNGCDSIRTLNLLVNPVKQITTTVPICEGESFFAGGIYQITSGVYTDIFSTYLGCDSVITTRLIVHPRPVPDLGSDTDLCTGSTLQLKPGLFDSYEWQDQSAGPGFIVSDTGRYWVKVRDVNNCIATDSIKIIKKLPAPAGFLNPVDTICQYEKLQLIPAGNYRSYQWSTGSGEPTVLIDQPGKYILKVQDDSGCYGSDTTYVYSKICRTGVYIPTAFTPNGDRLNDAFMARVYGNLVSFKLQVYNRWGELVFMSTDPYKSWDGKIKGKNLDSGVFVWKCRYQLQGEKEIEEKGTVTLIQ